MITNSISLNNSSTFPFKCKLCGHCCKQMLIRLTPFDIINLAEGLSLPTYQFISEYVVFLKALNVSWLLAALRHVKTGICLFKKGKKCSVHMYRPLPCRLFPIGRKDDKFTLYRAPYCKGSKTDVMFSVQEWLNVSEALPFLEASEKYYRFMKRITEGYDLQNMDPKNRNMFYKLLYDYDSASLESTISFHNALVKTDFCMKMAEWFLGYSAHEGREITNNSDNKFLNDYERQAIAVEGLLKNK